MTRMQLAYIAGVKLAYAVKLSDESPDVIKSEEQLRSLLKIIGGDSPKSSPNKVVINSEDKQSKASWGDKIELEAGSSTGIEV